MRTSVHLFSFLLASFVLCSTLSAAPKTTTEPSPVSKRLPRPSLFPYYRLAISREMLTRRRPKLAFYLFSRDGAPRLRFRIIDEKSTLTGFHLSLNGKSAGVIDKGGLVAEGGERGNFDGSFTQWIVLKEHGRRGLNRIVLTPRYSVDERKQYSRRFVDWCGELFFQKALKVEPASLFKGLRDMAEVEEDVYYHLRRFDELLRGLPQQCIPKPFVRDARRLPMQIRMAAYKLRARPFLKTADDFYRIAYGKRVRMIAYFEAFISRLNEIRWIWQEPDVHPLAAYIYATNRRKLHFHTYLHDVVLAKRATKNAYLVFCQEQASIGEEELRSLLKAQRAERNILSNLVEVADLVKAACDEEADYIYAKFPWWRTVFKKSFHHRVRNKFWPAGLYPRRNDLFSERVLLREYCRVVKLFARADLQQAKLRCSILEAFIDFPARKPAPPGMRPFHPEANP